MLQLCVSVKIMRTLESGGLIVKDRVVSQHMNIILGVDLSSMS